MKLLFSLTKAASKAGGDRYETKTEAGEDFVVYFPQSVSRKSGHPAPFLEIEVAV